MVLVKNEKKGLMYKKDINKKKDRFTTTGLLIENLHHILEEESIHTLKH